MGSPQHADLVHILTAYGRRRKPASPERRAGVLRHLLHIPMPVLLARADASACSAITRSAKTPGGVQRTVFVRGGGPLPEDSQHPDVYAAVVRAWDEGFTVVTMTKSLPEYMPPRRR